MRTIRSLLALAFLIASMMAGSPNGLAKETPAKEADGKFPTSGASKAGSGSGVIVGKQFVLTNRQVVEDDGNKFYDGFRIFVGPDFTRDPRKGRVRFICPDYDLALIELAEDVPAERVPVFDGVPPLATKVRTYGFPLGSQFGVALTATGGQISRQPIDTDLTDRSEEADIRRSVTELPEPWTSSGNSAAASSTSSQNSNAEITFSTAVTAIPKMELL